ncbi:uncharacterized protein LOC100116287 isoform X2 [Nasonia vitripennis]|uniref:Uncharacterized protein n=1 Tax=Nasonia vitripennis TaxID=7425 RepID=A0A7M7H530_NASVI|nr:uncharacterized protein LOC100116287 isoform X2 [Nasonia vitripennis]
MYTHNFKAFLLAFDLVRGAHPCGYPVYTRVFLRELFLKIDTPKISARAKALYPREAPRARFTEDAFSIYARFFPLRKSSPLCVVGANIPRGRKCLDLVELGESVMRAQRNPSGVVSRHQLQNSQGSIIEMDAETPGKDSMGSLGCFPPPTYESIYGKEEAGDMPPSYSDILLHRFANLPYEIEMQDYSGAAGAANGHDIKEEIELRSLENCPHIIGNPINSLTYPYAAAALAGCYSSQSLPRRNPSLISNPLDSYCVDNELASLRHLAHEQQRRRSASTSTATRARNSPRSRRTSLQYCEDEAAAAQRRDSRINVDDLPTTADNVMDNRYSHPWDDAMNSRNSARSDRGDDELDDIPRSNLVYVRSRRSEDDEPLRVPRESRISSEAPISWNLDDLDVRYGSELEAASSVGPQGSECDEAAADEEPGNFQTLADIRESRV